MDLSEGISKISWYLPISLLNDLRIKISEVLKMNPMLKAFLIEFGIDIDMLRILEREGYFPEDYIDDILKYYQWYLDGTIDFEGALDVLMEEIYPMRQIFVSGNKSDIYCMVHKEFIDYFVTGDFLEIGLDTTGLTDKEICKKYIALYEKTDNNDFTFLYDDKMIVIEEYNQKW